MCKYHLLLLCGPETRSCTAEGHVSLETHTPQIISLPLKSGQTRVKGVVHPKNTFFSIDYSRHGDLSSIILLVFVTYLRQSFDYKCTVLLFFSFRLSNANMQYKPKNVIELKSPWHE